MASIKELVIKLKAETSQMQQKIGAATGKLKEFEQKTKAVGATGQKSFSRLTNAVNVAAGAIGAFVAIKVVQFTQEMAASTLRSAEAYNQLRARVQNSTNSLEEANQVFELLNKSSNRSGASLDTIAQAFVRLRPAAEELNRTNAELVTFSETFLKMGALAGATSVEVNNAMIQLSQGLASGTLRGDELRSVMEQMPQVARTIAESMGLPFGEFRKAAQEGLVTAEQVSNAIINKSGEVDAAFSKLPLSIDRSLNRIQNGLFNLVGILNQSSHATDILAKAMAGLANFISRATSFIIQHQQEIADLTNLILNAGNKVFQGSKIIINSFLALVRGVNAAIINTIEGTINAFTRLGGIKVDLGADEFNRRFQSSMAAVNSSIAKFNARIDVSRLKTQQAVAPIENLTLTGGAGGVSTESGREKQVKGIKKAVDELKQSVDDTLPSLGRLDLSPEAIEQGTKESLTLRGLNDPFGEGATQISALKELQDTESELMKLRDLAPEAKAQLDNLSKSSQDMKLAFAGALNDIGRNFENTFIEAVTNGKLNFKDFTLSILEDISRLILRFTVIQPLVKRFTSLLTGGSGGSGGSFFGNLFSKIAGRAAGGDVQANRPYIVGERGPELMMPSKSGRIMSSPNTRNAMGGGQAAQPIVINQNFSVGVAQTVRAEMRNMKPEFIDATLQALDKDVRRNGSMARTVGRRS